MSHGTGFKTWLKNGSIGRELNYYRRLAKKIGTVEFFTYDTDDDVELVTQSEPVPRSVTKPRYVPYRLFGLIAPLIKFRAMSRADVYKTNQLSGAWTAAIAKLLLRKKLYVRCGYIWSDFARRQGTSNFRLKLIRAAERFALVVADVVSVATMADAKYLEEAHKVPRRKLHLLPNQIDTDTFAPTKNDLDISDNQFLFIGRLEQQKRPELAAEAVLKVPGAQLTIVGEGSLQAQVDSICSESTQINRIDSVPYNQIPELMRGSVAVVVTSSYEGNPKIVLEAMSCGVVVIGTDVPGISELITDRENGLLVESDANAIATAMEFVICNRASRRIMGQNARETIMEHNSSARISAIESKLLNDLVIKAGR